MSADEARRLRVLVIGALPPPIGGTTVSLDLLVRFLRESGIAVTTVDCGVRDGLGMVGTFARAVGQAIMAVPRVDVVSCHFSDRATLLAGWIFHLIARLAAKPFIHRQFGGSFRSTYESSGRFVRWLVERAVLSADRVLLQTLDHVEFFRNWSHSPPMWFPTARMPPEKTVGVSIDVGKRGLRCVFLGHVRREKGVLEAVEAVAAVPGCSLDIFGPLIGMRSSELTRPGIAYRGVVAPSEVAQVIAKYELLLFPTFHSGEGYPGTLVEASFVGLPFIATRWQALPEMFPDGAIFVEPRSAEAIADELRRLLADKSRLILASEKIRTRSAIFDARKVYADFARLCHELRDSRAPGAGQS